MERPPPFFNRLFDRWGSNLTGNRTPCNCGDDCIKMFHPGLTKEHGARHAYDRGMAVRSNVFLGFVSLKKNPLRKDEVADFGYDAPSR